MNEIEQVSLDELAVKLLAVRHRRLATQKEIEAATGVDQGTVSRVLRGKRRRVTDPIIRLDRYVNMLLNSTNVSEEILGAATAFLGRGGSEAELIASIHHSADLVSRRLATTRTG